MFYFLQLFLAFLKPRIPVRGSLHSHHLHLVGKVVVFLERIAHFGGLPQAVGVQLVLQDARPRNEKQTFPGELGECVLTPLRGNQPVEERILPCAVRFVTLPPDFVGHVKRMLPIITIFEG